jgi:putative tricarboxylic transport membrane protein
MRRGWQAAAAFFFALFAFAFSRAWSLPLEDALGPGPGFFPLWLAVLGMTLAAMLIIQVSRHDQMAFADAIATPNGGAVLRIFSILAGIAAAAALIDWLGFRLVALGFCTLLLPAVGARNPFVVIVFALLGSFGVFHVFYQWLKVPLPIGAFGV